MGNTETAAREQKPFWEPGAEGFETPFDMGYAHGAEDRQLPMSRKVPRPTRRMRKALYDNYLKGYHWGLHGKVKE